MRHWPYQTTKSNKTEWQTIWTRGNTKKRQAIDGRGTQRPLTSPLWRNVPPEMSQHYSWEGQQAPKVKPTWSCYTQHQRQVQRPSCSFWARLKTTALIPANTPCHSYREDRGQPHLQILINWPNCCKPVQLAKFKTQSLMFAGILSPLDLCEMSREKNAILN